MPRLAAGLTGLLVHPLGARLSRAVDRLFYGDRADPYAVLAGLTGRLRDGDVADVPRAVCEAVVGSLRLALAELVWAGALRRAGHAGRPDEVRAAPPRRAGRARRRDAAGGRAALDPRDPRAARGARRRRRTRVAALRLSTSCRPAGRRWSRPARRSAAGCAATSTTASARRWPARGCSWSRPATWWPTRSPADARRRGRGGRGGRRGREADHRGPATARARRVGLAGSLHALATAPAPPRWRCGGRRGPPTLPAAAEVACYRIAAEALANAARHSRARRVEVRLAVEGAALVLEVADDGGGRPGSAARARPHLDAAARRGAGRPVHVDPRGARPCGSACPEGVTARVLLVDDHPLFRGGVLAALAGADDLEVVGEAEDAAGAVAAAASCSRTWSSWTSTCRTARASTPRGRSSPRLPSVRVLMMTMSADDEAVVAAMRAGARGYFIKGAGSADCCTPCAPRPPAGRLQPGRRRPARRLLRQAGRRSRSGRLPAAHRPRARGPRPGRPRLRQPPDRARAVPVGQDRAQPRLERAHQARRRRPRRAVARARNAGLGG